MKDFQEFKLLRPLRTVYKKNPQAPWNQRRDYPNNTASGRLWVFALVALTLCTVHTGAQSIAGPLTLFLIRDQAVPYDSLRLGAQYGKLYTVPRLGLNKAQIQTEGTLIGETLELPSRGNMQDYSDIPPATYKGKAEQSTEYGWDIRFDLKGRPGILLHHGNYPIDTKGCILLGAKRSKGQQPLVISPAGERDPNSGAGPIVPIVTNSDVTIKSLRNLIESSGSNDILLVIE